MSYLGKLMPQFDSVHGWPVYEKKNRQQQYATAILRVFYKHSNFLGAVNRQNEVEKLQKIFFQKVWTFS